MEKGGDSFAAFVSRYWGVLLWIVTAIFAAGGLYSQFAAMDERQNVMDKQIQELKELEVRIIELEKRESYLEGFKDGQNK